LQSNLDCPRSCDAALQTLATSTRINTARPKTNNTGYVVCDPGITVSVNSTVAVAAAVKKYRAEAEKTGKTLKIRASRHKFHTTTSLACPDQQYAVPNGSLSHEGVLAVAILHDGLDKVLAVDPIKHTMTVGAGMRLNQLLPAATKYNMSVIVSIGMQFSVL